MKEAEEKYTAWRICCTLAVVVMGLAFTPLLIPAGVWTPTVAGMPYALWTGIALCIVMVGITYFATLVHPGTKKADRP
ncbi:multidrug transporter EmrE-like cation transporter [Lewinella aquimaris]|uniref:Multidrug transporter EmrE-like cation transporter n=1 Tax=Neolewinella aquimaris TaxID=1835722 RepID=A0A840E1M4_9BACT|nr:hypothetical protein [Neolewinella aquimaris]MBB4077615.1 multidrug transporter EmrE-like cation transporter [Neolewinella aquimaris]